MERYGKYTFENNVNIRIIFLSVYVMALKSVTGRWVCDDRFYGLVNRSNR